jgi:hypothetical protein
MGQTYPVTEKPPVTVDGVETLHIDIEWRNGHRDRVRVVHVGVRPDQPNSDWPSEVLVDGRSVNDLLRAFAQFMDWELEFPDNAKQAIFKFRS